MRNPLSFARGPIGAMSGFMLTLLLVAAVNFAQVFYENYQAASAAGTTYVDGMQITVCYFGPPLGFHPRFFAMTCLLVACLYSLTDRLRGRVVSLLAVAGALSAYLYWWVRSYQAFKSLSEVGVDFMNSPEIMQVAYLYDGNWWDVCVAVSLFAVLVLQAHRFVPKRFTVA